MEKIIGKKVDAYFAAYKNDIRTKIVSVAGNPNNLNEIIEFVMEYPRLALETTDFSKRKRVKNAIPDENRCIAKISSGEQCTRRKKQDCLFCGTHTKGFPHGSVETNGETPAGEKTAPFDVIAEDIRGIVYYVDKNNNVFKTEDIVHNRTNPAIIAKAVRTDGILSIPELGI